MRSAAGAASPAEDEELSRLLEQIEAAYRGGNYERGLSLVKRVLELKRRDVSALDRVGSIYFILGRYGEALAIWQTALPAEQDPQRRRELQESIAVARRGLGLPAETAPQPSPKPPRPKRPRRPDERLIEELYQQGTKHYARGEYLQAMNVFLRILDMDPDNAKAARALRRLNLREGAGNP